MRRVASAVRRPDWQTKIVEQGLNYWLSELPDGTQRSYWEEAAYYAFDDDEAELLKTAGRELFAMFIEAGEYIIKHPKLMERMGVPVWAHEAVVQSWYRALPGGEEWGSVHGRVDLAYGGRDAADPAYRTPRFYEYNCDTAESLPESAIAQWSWYEDTGQGDGQYNDIWESLVEAYRRNLACFEQARGFKPVVYFVTGWHDNLLPELAAGVPPEELAGIDVATCSYENLQNMRLHQEACAAAGYQTEWMYVEQIWFRPADGRFYDNRIEGQRRHLDVVFKLYDWDEMFPQPNCQAVVEDLMRDNGTLWIEPPHAAIWSNKGLSVILWQLFGDDPAKSKWLIPSWFAGNQPPGLDSYVLKPVQGKEGGSISVIVDGKTVLETAGEDAGQQKVVQAYVPPPAFAAPDGRRYPTTSIWMIDGLPAGLAVREDRTVVTGKLSSFVPHVVNHSGVV